MLNKRTLELLLTVLEERREQIIKLSSTYLYYEENRDMLLSENELAWREVKKELEKKS